MAALQSGPLPKSKLSRQVVSGYSPAPLDLLSLENGVAKFDHEQKHFRSVAERAYCLRYLNTLFPFLRLFSTIASDAIVTTNLNVELRDRAAGQPWSIWGCPTKQSALKKFGLEQIENYYSEFSTVISSTLKDEIRLVGKDARLFRPQDVSSYVEGCRLFSTQNEYMMSTLHNSPIFVGFQCPGPDIPYAYQQLRSFGGNNYASDGTQWDANFPVDVADLICEFRSQYSDADRMYRYYCQMYCGYTNVLGNLIVLPGQPSGHFNTTIDNCLCHCVLFALHAFRNGLTLDQLLSQVMYRCCGDDLIWSDRTGLYYPELLSETYFSMGVYLEFESLEPQSVDSLTFVGMRLLYRTYQDVGFYCTALRSDRTRASCAIHRLKNSPYDTLGKLASLTQLSFGDNVLYQWCRSCFDHFLMQCVQEGTVSLLSSDVSGWIRSIDESTLVKSHTRWESFPFSLPTRQTVSLNCLPFKRNGAASSIRSPCSASFGVDWTPRHKTTW